MSQKLSDVEREIREEERRRRRKRKKKRRQNRVQPILEPISSHLALINAQRARQLEKIRRRRSDSSDHSRASAQCVNLALNKNDIPLQSLGSSKVLSESAVTEDSNSISEIELPLVKPKMPDFSIFTVNTVQPSSENKEDNSNANTNTTNLKGANPSPSGSVRRGRRREVKLEMTETSFYQEDDENIEIGGNQTIHTEENCHEVAEVKANLKDIGPLVNEIFEQAKANSANGKPGRQRDPMGSSRLGSASSKESKSSRGSQSASKDLKYSNTKVNLPPEVPRNDSERTNRKRPFSGDYILASRKNSGRHEESTRKSQSQPGSRVSSATASHKRQISHNGKMDFSDGMSWSRFLQMKGYSPGQMFGPVGMPPTTDKVQSDFYNSLLFQESEKFMPNPYTGQHPFLGSQNMQGRVPVSQTPQGPFPVQLQIMDKSHVDNPESVVHPQSPVNVLSVKENRGSPADILHVEQEHKQFYEIRRPYTNPYRRHRDPTEGDVLGNIPDNDDEARLENERPLTSEKRDAFNILNVEAEHHLKTNSNGNVNPNVNVLNVAAEQLNDTDSEFEDTVSPSSNRNIVNIDVLDSEKVKDIDQPHIIVHRTNVEDSVKLCKDDSVRTPSPIYAKSRKVKEKKESSEITSSVNDHHKLKPSSPVEAAKSQEKDNTFLGTARNRGNFLDGHKISAFDGQGSQKTKKVPQANFLEQDPSRLNGAVVLSKPLYNAELQLGKDKEKDVNKQNVVTKGKTSKPIKIGGKQNIKDTTKKLDSKPPSSEASGKNVIPPMRNRLGSDGFGSSGSRSTSALTRSSGNSGNSQNSLKRSESGLGALNLGFIKPKEKSSSKSKVVPERSVGMFDFVDDGDNLESDYDDMSTDNLTDTYTYTDYDDDLTEVSSLPC